MQIEWDEAKRLADIKKHGFDFVDTVHVFRGVTITFEDVRVDYSETRLLTFGMLRDKVVAIAHTERRNKTRIISMRKAERHEAEIYFSQIFDGLDTN